MSITGAHKTAIQRWSLSRPVALALEDGLLSTKTTFFDYGCGRGGDLKRLHKMGVPVSGWDPAYFPDEERTPADVVNLGYVVNVIEDLEERAVALCAAWELAQKLLIVSARLEWEAQNVAGNFQGDGIVTSKRTFQKFYAQDELRDWIQATTGRSCVAAAPGVFYVFRETSDEQAFTANRLTLPRRVPTVRLSEEDFKRHQDLLQPLMEFISHRGRLPTDLELDVAPQIREIFGGLARAFSLIRRVTGLEQWEAIRHERRDDLLVYLALAAFGKRPKLGQLPDRAPLTISARSSGRTRPHAPKPTVSSTRPVTRTRSIGRVGRRQSARSSPERAVHSSQRAISHLPPLLRVYEGCGRQLAGSVDGMTLVKLSRYRPQVSYLVYPDFDSVRAPGACGEHSSPICPRLNLHHRDYRRTTNPPILHRKELLVTNEHPRRSQFARLSDREDKLGLFDTHQPIGMRKYWQAILSARHLTIQGHQITSNIERSNSS